MVSEVRVRSAVMAASWAHALSTEAEEVMGLYLGKVEGDVLAILSLTPIRRTTKQKDRVEIDPNDLVAVSTRAEEVGLRVVGWYHSHPHITVHPSHVDLRTQLSYQAMDSTFVGLIYSAFNYDPKLGQDTKEVIAFQTLEVEGVPECRYLPLLPVSVGVEEHLAMGVATSTLAVADIIMREEMEEHDKAAGGGGEALFNSSLLAARLYEQHRVVAAPALAALGNLADMQRRRVAALQARKRELKEQLEELEELEEQFYG